MVVEKFGESNEPVVDKGVEPNKDVEPAEVSDDAQKRADKFREMEAGLDKDKMYEMYIKGAFDMRRLYQVLNENGDITAPDGHVYDIKDVIRTISSLTGSDDPNLGRVTRTYGLRNKVKILLLEHELSKS